MLPLIKVKLSQKPSLFAVYCHNYSTLSRRYSLNEHVYMVHEISFAYIYIHWCIHWAEFYLTQNTELTWSNDSSLWFQLPVRYKWSTTIHPPSLARRGSWQVTKLLHLASSSSAIFTATETWWNNRLPCSTAASFIIPTATAMKIGNSSHNISSPCTQPSLI